MDTDQLQAFTARMEWNKLKSEGGKEEAEKERIARRPKRWAIARRIKRRRFLSCDVAQGVSPCSQGFA